MAEQMKHSGHPSTSSAEALVSILLVDDTPANLTPANLVALRDMLEVLGQNLVEVRSGEEAIAQLKTVEFAVVLIDVRMPGLSGFDTAKLIRADECSRHTPIIFFTADDIEREQIEAGYALGAVDFFVMPLSPVVVRAKVRGFVTLFQEKQRARHEADQLRMLIQGTTDYAIFMLDPQGRVVTWNAGAERFKGYKAEEIIGQHFTKFYPQEALDRGWPAYELKVALAEGRFEDEGWRVRKDGTQFWANVVITALRDEQGQLRGFSKVTRDLTERRKAEEGLRRSEERFRLLVEGAKDYAIFLLDPQGHIASWNPGAERIKQYKADEIIGQHFSKFYPQEALDRGWPAHELKVATAEGRFEDEGWRVRKDGTQFWANVVITALNDEQGKLLGFSKITRDMTERKLAEENARSLAEEAAARQVAHEERERLQVTLASIGDAVISTDANGRVDFLNRVAEELVGWKSGEAFGRTLEDVFRIVNEDTRQPVENPALRALTEGKIVGLANHTVLISKDGTERPIDDSAAPILNERGNISGSVLVFRDISERKRSEAALGERLRLLALNAAVGEALVQGNSLPAILQRCAEGLVEHLDGAFARIWTLNERDEILELRASAGIYTHLDGPHSRVPVGKYKIGLIAQEKKPHLTNEVVGDPRVSEQEWARREAMVAFAGYPLVVDDRLVGVMAMFARKTLSTATLDAMASVADQIAVGIERKTSQERLDEQREWLAVTLASIGDAVITTDNAGRVTFLNGVAEGLTGWNSEDAQGKPLVTVFPIRNEETLQPVENPVEKVLREGVIVGLANHTVLVARDGMERPIDDSAAPIRDLAGSLIGVVLIFRDVTEQRQAERELREQTANAEALLRVGNLLAQEHDLHLLVQVVTDESTRLCAAQFGAFFYNVVGDRGEAYTLYTLSGVPREAFARFPMPRNTALFGPTFRGEGVVRLDDVTQDPRYGKSGPHFGMPEGHLPVKSYLAVPVISRTGEVLGGLFFGHAEAGVFTPQHERLLVGIAGQAAVAIDNARLHQRTQASAERLNLALSAADLGDWNWDAASGVVTFSERAAEVFGIPPGPRMTWTEMQGLFHEDDRERVSQEVQRVIAERVQYDIEYRVNRQDGSQIWVGVLGRATYDAFGQATGMFGVIQDVTDRKRLEESLRASEARFRGLMEQAPFSVQVFSPDGQPIRVNRAWEELWGVTLDQIDGYNVLEDRQLEAKGVLPLIQQAFAGEPAFIPAIQYDPNETIPGQTRHEDPVRWVAAVAYPLKDDAGSIHEVVVVHDDITARRKAEAALRESEEKLRLLADTIPQLAWMARPDGHIFWYNRRWYEYTGTTPEQMEGWGWQSVHDPDVLAQVVEQWKHSIETGEPFNMVFPLRSADGVLRPFLTRVNPLRNDEGRIVYWFGTNTDISEQKRAEEELRYRHELLRAITDTATTAIFMMDEQSRCTFMNPAAEQMTGYLFREAEGQILHDLIHHTHPDGSPYPVSECPIDRALPEGFIMHNHEDLFVRKDCSLFPVLCNARPVVRGGVVVGTVIEVRDITLQKQAEAALRESEERLRLALDAGRMGVWDWNVRTGDLKWSDSLEPLHGLAPGTFGGTFEHFQQLIHPNDREAVQSAIQGALQSGGEFYVEFRNLRPNGGIHWIAGSGKAFYGEDGQPLRMIGIGLDVTQRKRDEQTARFLADASAALAVLVDFDSTLQKVASLAVPHFADWMTVDVLEDNGNLRRVAVAHADPAKVQLAHDLHRRFPADPSAPNGVWNILRTGEAEIVQAITDDVLVASIKDDELLDIIRELGLTSYIGVPLTVRGKALGVLTFIIAESDHAYDETDLAVAKDLASRAAIAVENSQLYRELRDADRRKDEFLATLAHELRNPLAPIRNGLQVLRLAGDEMADEVRSMMDRQLNQMVRLVDDLLDVSRITRNKLELRKERVSLAAVINSAVETNRPLMEQAGHSFSLSLPPEPVYLDADLTRLAQVFSNLLNNATKYTERGGYISLTGELSGAEVLVEVRDTGLGIPAEALPSLFELFSQVDRNMEWAQGGLGIGLSLVRRLVEMHDGQVEARSQGPGQGSQFLVRLPVVAATRQIAASHREDGLSASAKKRILVVDDNQDSALSLGMMLQLMGNEIHTAHDGLAAVEAAEKFRPELIILDIGLPKLNGYDACRRIREQPWSTGMVIAALTGWGQEEDRRRSQEAGFDHHLVKPVEIVSLEKLLAESPPHSPSPKSTTLNRASLRVLAVDDRRDATFMLQKLLTAAGHDVRTAADGPSALATALDFQPDVVLLDISLPGMSGLEVAKRIRQLPTLKDIVLVALTGYGEEADRQRSFEAGFNHHLVKPADIRIVREILATVNVK